MTLYAYKVKIYGEKIAEHKGVLFASDFYQAMLHLGETYEPEMGEVFLAAVDNTAVVEVSPTEFERILSEGGFYDGYAVL